jgi:hypothetical protein
VAGIVSDAAARAERPPRPEMYIPLAQFLHFMAGTQARTMTVVAKVGGA